MNEAFKENNGKTSITRILLLSALISCIGLAYMGVALNRDLTGLGVLIGAIITPIAGLMGFHRFAERKE
jgi:hypothetical protein